MIDIDDLIEDIFAYMDFDKLTDWADILEVEYDEDIWLDDDYPEKTGELITEVSDALRRAVEFDARPLFEKEKQYDALKQSWDKLVEIIETAISQHHRVDSSTILDGVARKYEALKEAGEIK